MMVCLRSFGVQRRDGWINESVLGLLGVVCREEKGNEASKPPDIEFLLTQARIA